MKRSVGFASSAKPCFIHRVPSSPTRGIAPVFGRADAPFVQKYRNRDFLQQKKCSKKQNKHMQKKKLKKKKSPFPKAPKTGEIKEGERS